MIKQTMTKKTNMVHKYGRYCKLELHTTNVQKQNRKIRATIKKTRREDETEQRMEKQNTQ